MNELEALVGTMTLGELAQRTGLGVAQIVDLALAGALTRSNSTSPHASLAVPRGGLRIDRVLTALSACDGPTKLEDVRARTGGSVPQVRSALQKLAKAGRVTISGERRGTRYALG